MSDYLTLVQTLQRETGVAGSSIATVTAQTGIYEKLVNWVADADIYIQGLKSDWKFMWAEYSDSTSVGNAFPTSPADLGLWDRRSFYLDYSLKSNKHLQYTDYQKYKHGPGRGVLTNRKPHQVAIKPNNQLILINPPDAIYSITGEYWKKPTRLLINTDISPIPKQYERVIILQAKIWYAEEQEIPAVRDEAKMELYGNNRGDEGLLKRLKAHELPGSEGRIMGEAPNITVVPE